MKNAAIPESCIVMFQRVMPLVLKELASPDAMNRRNAAFCVGELCKNGGESALKYPQHACYIVVMNFVICNATVGST